MRNAIFPLSHYGCNEKEMLDARATDLPESLMCYSDTLLMTAQLWNNDQFSSVASPSPSWFRNYSLPEVSHHDCYDPAGSSKRKAAVREMLVSPPDPGNDTRNSQSKIVDSNDQMQLAVTSGPPRGEGGFMLEPKKKSLHVSAPKPSGTGSRQSKPPLRSQKIGDKVRALHQLVSPFGKTDTASVLQQAKVQIRLLHEQIEVLSMPYFIYRPFSTQGRDYDKCDLLSRGLSLVPVSSAADLVKHGAIDRSLTVGKTSVSPNFIYGQL